MTVELLRTDTDLVAGRLLERQNRFVLDVDFEAGGDWPPGVGPTGDTEEGDAPIRPGDGGVAEVYLPETGRLTTVLVDDATVVCEPVADPDRRTAFTALAVHNGDVYVTVEAVRANAMLAAAVERDLVPALEGWSLVRREPALPEGGRADLLLASEGDERYVEVKALTHAENGVGKFPDAPTKRGRRHLRDLTALAEDGTPASVVFVTMRPDVEVVRPFREIDPDFADALAEAADAGVGVHAVGSRFAPPAWELLDPSLPVELV